MLSESNKGSYGLSVVNGWNTWEDRKEALNRFVDYALAKDVYFYSGKETIEYVRGLANNPVVEESDKVTTLSNNWSYVTDTEDGTIVDAINQEVSFATENSWAYFYKTLDAPLSKVTHIEVPEYTITDATFVGVVFADGREASTLLNNLGTDVNSGKILLTQLEPATYAEDQSPIDFSQDIIAVIVSPQARSNVDSDWNFVSKGTNSVDIPSVNLYSDDEVSTNINSSIAVINAIRASFINNSINITVPTAELYSIRLNNARGQLISEQSTNLLSGSNVINVGSIASGVYIINILDAAGAGITTRIIK